MENLFETPLNLPLIGRVRSCNFEDRRECEHFKGFITRELSLIELLDSPLTFSSERFAKLLQLKGFIEQRTYRNAKAELAASTISLLGDLDVSHHLRECDKDNFFSDVATKRDLRVLQLLCETLGDVFAIHGDILMCFYSREEDMPLYWMNITLGEGAFHLNFFARSLIGRFCSAGSGGPIALSLMKLMMDLFYPPKASKMYLTALEGTQIALSHAKLGGKKAVQTKGSLDFEHEYVFPNGFSQMWQNWIVDQPKTKRGRKDLQGCVTCSFPHVEFHLVGQPSETYCSRHCFTNKLRMI